jgi:hypothetical protein
MDIQRSEAGTLARRAWTPRGELSLSWSGRRRRRAVARAIGSATVPAAPKAPSATTPKRSYASVSETPANPGKTSAQTGPRSPIVAVLAVTASACARSPRPLAASSSPAVGHAHATVSASPCTGMDPSVRGTPKGVAFALTVVQHCGSVRSPAWNSGRGPTPVPHGKGWRHRGSNSGDAVHRGSGVSRVCNNGP